MTPVPGIPVVDYREFRRSSSSWVSRYKEEGSVVIRDLVQLREIDDLEQAVRMAVVERLRSLSHSVGEHATLDDAFNVLVGLDQGYAMEIIRAVKDMPEYLALVSGRRLISAVCRLVGADRVACVHDMCLFRIDPPRFHERDFDWHQDYPYMVTSEQSVVAWLPLLPIERDMGRLRVCPRSHHDLRKIRLKEGPRSPGRGIDHHLIESLLDRDDLDARAVEIPDVQPGDVLLFHCFLVHVSGSNRSSRSRWVINPRYSPITDPAWVRRGWACRRDGNADVLQHVRGDVVVR